MMIDRRTVTAGLLGTAVWPLFHHWRMRLSHATRAPSRKKPISMRSR